MLQWSIAAIGVHLKEQVQLYRCNNEDSSYVWRVATPSGPDLDGATSNLKGVPAAVLEVRFFRACTCLISPTDRHANVFNVLFARYACLLCAQ